MPTLLYILWLPKNAIRSQNKYNILVICATGYGSAQMLKSRIENELGGLVHITDVIGYYDISDDKLKDIDFIISSIDLSNLIFSIPVFTVSVFLSEDELKTLKREIASLSQSNQHTPSPQKTREAVEGYFDDYFSERSFFFLSETNKEDVIKQLIISVSDGEDSEFERRISQLIGQREAMSSVVFSETIAVPHPLKAVGDRHHIAVAIIKDGLYWNREFPAIKLVFLTSMSIYENEGLPELASCIVELVNRLDIQEEILKCQSFEQFKALFLKLEER